MSLSFLLALVVPILFDEDRTSYKTEDLSFFKEAAEIRDILNASALFESEKSYSNEIRDPFYATMLAIDPNLGFSGNSHLEELANDLGWLGFTKNAEYATFLNNYKNLLQQQIPLLTEANLALVRALPGAFVWNVSEPSKGVYDWTLPDLLMTAAGEAEVQVSAVISPYAVWDQYGEVNLCSNSNPNIDFVYFDASTDFVNDLEAYATWLGLLVERYDGDGVEDMPGLTTKVFSWEIGNEMEGPCGGYKNNVDLFVELVEISSEVIHAADSEAIVLNGGTLDVTGTNGTLAQGNVNFWTEYFELGGGEYIDAFNIHYNQEKNTDHGDMDIYEVNVSFFRELLEDEGHADMPIWITEFGGFQSLGEEETERTPEEQSAWYLRAYTIGLHYGVNHFFIDLKGPDTSGIGSSSYYDFSNTARPFLGMSMILTSYLNDIEESDELAEGQYLFETEEADIYIWWSEDSPENLPDLGILLEIDGNMSLVDSTELPDSSYDEPLIYIVR